MSHRNKQINLYAFIYFLSFIFVIKNMSSFPPVKNYKQLMTTKIKNVFNFLREVYKGIDNNIYESLNEEYEEELIALACLIPNDWMAGFYDSVDLVYDLFFCIDVSVLSDVVAKHSKARIWFNVDSYRVFLNNFIINKGYGSQVEKALTNVCNKLKPVFSAVDKLIANPNGVLQKIAMIASNNNNENNNVLNSFI